MAQNELLDAKLQDARLLASSMIGYLEGMAKNNVCISRYAKMCIYKHLIEQNKRYPITCSDEWILEWKLQLKRLEAEDESI